MPLVPIHQFRKTDRIAVITTVGISPFVVRLHMKGVNRHDTVIKMPVTNMVYMFLEVACIVIEYDSQE